jgi:hypothetical protein
MDSGQIHLRQVLALMDTYELDRKPQIFSLQFIKDNGEIRELKRAAKGHKSGVAKNEKSNFGYNLKEKGIVIIRDLDFRGGEGRTISVRIEGIRKFNGLTVFS